MDSSIMSEKQPLVEHQPSPLPSRRSRWVKTPLLLLGLVVAGSLWNLSQTSGPDSTPDDNGATKPWSWEDITPSQDLQWEDCYDDYKCARLDVPMDWQEPSDAKRVVLGVIKLPAKSDRDPVPPLMMNPGGPGGSGISIIKLMGKEIQAVAGDNHDIISWDPRGVGTSTPRIDCWESYQARKIWKLQGTHVADEAQGLIYDAVARAKATSATCEETLNESSILHHISSGYSARDMLEIVEKTGNKKFRWWGFSYGTILGGVIASLYPDRIDRFVSDGNVDYTSWFEGDRLLFSQDADRVLEAFDTACHKAGPEKCDLWDESPKHVQGRRDAVLEGLRRSPVVVPAWANDAGPEIPLVVTYSRIEIMTREMIYKPISAVEKLAAIFAALGRGDGLPYWEHMSERQDKSALMCAADDTPATVPLEVDFTEDAFQAINCADSVPVDMTPEEFDKYARDLRHVSRYVGASNIQFRLACAGRTVRPDWRPYPKSGDTIITDPPILFLNNVVDNITPLESAHNNSAHFPGSVVLKQQAYGHCSFAAPSKCTAEHIRTYFQSGKLPDPGTECPQDYDFFEFPDEDQVAFLEQDELSRASWELSRRAELAFTSLHGL